MTAATPRPLDGYTVLDLTGSVATAYCARFLADFGARVVNIEPPQGHQTRSLPPHRPGVAAPESSGLHALLSPNKQSVVLRIDDDDDREALWEWIAQADVILEAEPPGRLEALGIGFEAMAQRAPQVVLCSLSWWGQTGPWAARPGNDAAVFSGTGQSYGVGPAVGPPYLPPGYPAQVFGGVTASIAILTELVGAILGTRRRAAHIDLSLLESALQLTEVAPPSSLTGALPRPRAGINHLFPSYVTTVYETKAGWVGICTVPPHQWDALMELVPTPLADMPELRAMLTRWEQRHLIDEHLAAALKHREAEEVFHAGQAMRIPVALCPTMAEMYQSAQLRALDAFRPIAHPDLPASDGGPLEAPAAPFRLHATPRRRDGDVTRLGASGRAAPADTSRAGTPHSAHGGRGPSLASPHPDPVLAPRERPHRLQGLRVLDLTMGWAGPLASRHLADMGAEVIKVEGIEFFDWWRGWEHTTETVATFEHEKTVAFNVVQRNKFGITLDLRQPRGAELFKQLVAISDVVLENYSAGVMSKLGIDWETLRAINPGLVMLSMPPFGGGGPWESYRAYGSTVEYASGIVHLQGRAEDPPVMFHVAYGDAVAGINGATAILLAVLHQQRTGEGQYVDICQVQAMTEIGLHGIAEQMVLGKVQPRLGNRSALVAPQGVYAAPGDDTWLMLSVPSDTAWRALVDLISDPALTDPAYATVEGRRTAHDAIDARIAAWIGGAPVEEREEELAAIGVIAATVLQPAQVLTHPQLDARGFWQWLEKEHAGYLPYPVVAYRSRPSLSGGAPHAIDMPPPTLGQHSALILQGLLGLSDAEIDALARSGVIGDAPLVADTF